MFEWSIRKVKWSIIISEWSIECQNEEYKFEIKDIHLENAVDKIEDTVIKNIEVR